MNRIWIFSLIILGVISYASAIMCYECNSATNPLCTASIDLPSSLRKNCSELDRGIKHTLCRKIVQQVENSVNGRLPLNRVIRSCGWDESKYKAACYQRSGYGSRQEICTCSTDYCNSSSVSNLATILLINIVIIKCFM